MLPSPVHPSGEWLSQLARLRASPFVRRVGVLSSGAAIGHAFTLASAPILSRIYGPDEFGVLGLFSSFIIVMGVVVSLQYEMSIVSGRDEEEATYLTFAALGLALPTSTLAAFILWIMIRFSWLGYGGLPGYTSPLLLLCMFCIGLFTALRYWCLREGKFGQVSHGVVAQNAGRAISQAALGALGFRSGGLLVGEALGRGMGMSRMLRSAWPVLRRYAPTLRRERLMEVLWRYRKFPMYSLPSSFLDMLCICLPLPLLIRLYGVALGGYYALVWRAITAPSVVLTTAVADTFHSHLAVCVRETPEQVMALFRRTSLTLLLIGMVPTAILWIWSEPLFRWVFGAPWALSGTMAAIIAPWYLAQFVVSPVSRVVAVLSGQESKLVWDAVCVTSILVLFYIAQARNLPALDTIRILSWLSALLYVAYFLMLVLIIHRFNRRPRASHENA